jgi:hypothetical protein
VIKFIKREGIFAFFIKVLDIFLRPFAVSLLSFLNLKDHDINLNPHINKQLSKEKIFLNIYKNDYWKVNDSSSGIGSDLNSTRIYAKALDNFVNRYKIKSIFDVPCGDFIWMNEFLKKKNIRYKGGDIVQELVKDNRKKFPLFEFCNFDLTKDHINENFDVLHVRDCLFHFSFKDIKKTLKNIINFNTKYILITNHQSFLLKNYDIQTGKFRYLDFSKQPFFFPKPILKLKDYKIGEFPRYVNIWKNEDLKIFLKNI